MRRKQFLLFLTVAVILFVTGCNQWTPVSDAGSQDDSSVSVSQESSADSEPESSEENSPEESVLESEAESSEPDESQENSLEDSLDDASEDAADPVDESDDVSEDDTSAAEKQPSDSSGKDSKDDKKKNTNNVIEPDDDPKPVDLGSEPLVISEVMPKNKNYPIDGYFCDWIELYNNSDAAITLSNYCLSDSKKELKKNQLPNVKLMPGAYYILKCGIDLTFTLSADGDESVYLSTKAGVLQYSLKIPKCKADRVVLADGSVSNLPTPGKPNLESISYTPTKSLLISEVVTDNKSLKQHADGNYYGMVELYNASGSARNLSDYYLSDSPLNLQKCRLPNSSLESGAYIVVYASGEETDDPNCLPMTLSGAGKTLYVSTASGEIVDYLYVPVLDSNKSYGRYNGDNVYFKSPSVGYANSVGFREASTPVVADVKSGTYSSGISVKLSTADGGKIHYTTNGETPTASSPVYDGSAIAVNSVKAIRAININGKQTPSDIATFTYLIDIPDYTLDVIQVSVKPSEFKNIYENYRGHTEIAANVSYIVGGKEEFSIDCGFKLNGKSSRGLAKKSFQLKFRNKYGASKLEYKMFDNLDIKEFDSLVLRSGSAGAANFRAFIHDEFCTSIVGDSESNVLVQAYKPVNLYVNDEYYGIYYVREKVDDDFVAAHWNVNSDSVDIVKSMTKLEYGYSASGWLEVWNYVLKNSLKSDEAYEWMDQHVDLQEVIDYYIIQSWTGNTDAANVRVYHSSENDGKWHMILFDFDMSLQLCRKDYGYGTVDSLLCEMTTYNSAGVRDYNAVIYKLMMNEKFREQLRERLYWWAENNLSAESIVNRWDSMIDEIRHDMEYSIPVWKDRVGANTMRYHSSVSAWLAKADAIRESYMCQQRLDNFLKEWEEYLVKFSKK